MDRQPGRSTAWLKQEATAAAMFGPLQAIKEMNYLQIQDLVGLPDCSQGYSLKELLQIEQQLNKRLPVSLRKYYQCFGKEALLTNGFHRLKAPLELSVSNGYLLFYEENQGVWIAGIPVEALPAEDTAVWLSYDEGQSWEKFCDKLSEFLIAMSFFQILEGRPFVAVKEGVEANAFETVIRNWQELGGTCPQVNTRFFSNSTKNQLIGVTEEVQNQTFYFHIATTTQEDYGQLVAILGIEDWDYSSVDD